MVTQISTVAQFEEIIKENNIVVADFYATWCGPCKMLAPVIESFSSNNVQYKVIKVDVDKLPELAQKYGVYSIPHVQVIVNGAAVGSVVGYRNQEQLTADIKNLL